MTYINSYKFRQRGFYHQGVSTTKAQKNVGFYVLLTVHLGLNLFNEQPDVQFVFVYVYFSSLRVSSIQLLIIRRFNCINTISGICHYVGDRLVCRSKPAYQTVTYIEWHIPDIVLIQLNLLMMSTWMLETCRELKYIQKRIVLQVGH